MISYKYQSSIINEKDLLFGYEYRHTHVGVFGGFVCPRGWVCGFKRPRFELSF